jgi:hypothetical protein
LAAVEGGNILHVKVKGTFANDTMEDMDIVEKGGGNKIKEIE